jgi:hypothetical protein
MDIMDRFSRVVTSRAKFALPIVPFKEWNIRVIESAESFNGSESERYKRFPSTKIQSTIDGMVRADEELRSRSKLGDVESTGIVRLNTSKAERLSEALRSVRELGQEHVEKWIEYWEAKELFV